MPYHAPAMMGHPAHPFSLPHGPVRHAPRHPHGFCHACCHPAEKCCCGHRECRKVAKELLVEPGKRALERQLVQVKAMATMMSMPDAGEAAAAKSPAAEEAGAAAAATGAAGTFRPQEFTTHAIRLTSDIAAGKVDIKQVEFGVGTAIIGGGCCVHLSIEYMPSKPLANQTGIVAAFVMDSELTVLAWGKVFTQGYHVKECIISTKPGARLFVEVLNAVARVRWCEIFSC